MGCKVFTLVNCYFLVVEKCFIILNVAILYINNLLEQISKLASYEPPPPQVEHVAHFSGQTLTGYWKIEGMEVDKRYFMKESKCNFYKKEQGYKQKLVCLDFW